MGVCYVRRWEKVLHLLLAATAFAACLAASRDGVGIDADSAAYLSAAENVADGHGVATSFTLFTDHYRPREAAELGGRVPLTHFPPAYPLALGAIAALGVPVESAARALGAVLLGMNLLLLVAIAVHLLSSPVARVAAVVLAAVGPVAGEVLAGAPDRTWLLQHSQAMSEGLFTTFALASILAILHFERARTTRSLQLVILATALSLATRYTGLALVGVAAGAVAVWSPGSARRRLARGAATAAAAAAPTICWQLGVIVVQDAPLARTLHWPSRGASRLPQVFEGWLGVSAWSPALRHALLLAVLAAVVVAVRVQRSPAAAVLAAYVASYIAVVVVTRAAVDASTPIDDRMFSPAQGPFYVLVFGAIGSAALAHLSDRELGLMVRAIGIGIPVGLALASLPDAWRLVGDGLPSRPPPPDTVAAAATLPSRALLATNVPTQVWEHSGRSSILVPLRMTPETAEPSGAFEDEVEELAALVCERGGYIILLGREAGGFGTVHLADAPDFRSFEFIRVVNRLRDGVVLGATPGVPCS